MYETKTKQRLSKLFDSELDGVKLINGVEVEPIEVMIDKINWSSVYDKATPTSFHGDLQPENVIYDNKTNSFVLIDWRQSFGNSIEYGDVYYDLSKIYHAILINGQTILKDMFDFSRTGQSVTLDFYAKSNLVSFMSIFKQFCQDNNYSWENVKLLGILHYLNICTLYDNFKGGKYGNFLFLYGKYLLTKYQKEVNNE